MTQDAKNPCCCEDQEKCWVLMEDWCCEVLVCTNEPFLNNALTCNESVMEAAAQVHFLFVFRISRFR